MARRIALLLLLAAAASAFADDPPIVRYTTWMLVPPGPVTIESRFYGATDFSYADQPTFRVLDLNGDAVATVDGTLGQTCTLAVPDGSPLSLLRLQPGANYAVPVPEADTWWYIATPEAPLNVVNGFDGLYFYVPPGLNAATIFAHAFSIGEAGRLVITDLEGAEIASLESDFNEPEALLFQAPPEGALLRLSLVAPENLEWSLDDAAVWLGPELPGLLAPTPEAAAEVERVAPQLGIETDWTPLVDFEGVDSPIGTIQWAKLVPEDATLPAYDVALSDERAFGGEQSLRVEVRFPEAYAETGQQLKLFTLPVPADGIGKVRLFLYGDGSGRGLRVRVRDASQEQHYFDPGPITWVGWQAIVTDFERAATAISGGDENKRIDGPTVNVVLEIGHARSNPVQSVLYVDDIAISPRSDEAGEAQ